MAIFADYEFYTGSYSGTAVPLTDYARLASAATAFVKGITQQRADADDATKGEAAKLAMCAVVDVMALAEANGGRLPKGEGVSGDYYAYYESTDVGLQCYMAAKWFLMPTGWLFLGV